MKTILKSVFILLITTIVINVKAQERAWENIDTTGFYKKEIVNKKGLTLTIINKDSLFNPAEIQRMADVFWKVYPQELKRFNRKAAKNVTILISKDYKGVAATSKNYIKVDEDWLKVHPEDVDLLTHECMHIVQAYQWQTANLWLSEGIADYARYVYGINNEKAGWSLTPFKKGQSYHNSYRISARFLVWLEKHKNRKIVDKLDKALRNNTYTTDTWVKLTGKNVDDLWAEYAENPVI